MSFNLMETKAMNLGMIKKLDKVLARVKDPQSELPLNQLDLVERFRYSENQNTLYVFLNFSGLFSGCMACAGISIDAKSRIESNLKQELKNEFPNIWIKLV